VHSLFGKINHVGLKHNSLYLGLVLPSLCNKIKKDYGHYFLHQQGATQTVQLFTFNLQDFPKLKNAKLDVLG
jgi:hypothetical protein